MGANMVLIVCKQVLGGGATLGLVTATQLVMGAHSGMRAKSYGFDPKGKEEM